jgi:hypothetical protein
VQYRLFYAAMFEIPENASASVMIQKFVTMLRRFHHELLDLNHTSRINELVSLEIPKFAKERAAGMDANLGIGTLAAHNRLAVFIE